MLVLNDMVSRDDVPFFSDNDAGTQAVNRQPFLHRGIPVLGRLRNGGHPGSVYADQHALHQPGYTGIFFIELVQDGNVLLLEFGLPRHGKNLRPEGNVLFRYAAVPSPIGNGDHGHHNRHHDDK